MYTTVVSYPFEIIMGRFTAQTEMSLSDWIFTIEVMDKPTGTWPSFFRRNMHSSFPVEFAMAVCQGFGSKPTGDKGNRFSVAKHDFRFVCYSACDERRGAKDQAKHQRHP